MKIRIAITSLLLLFLACVSLYAKDTPAQILNWPSDENTLLRFTITKIQKVGSYSNQNAYMIDTAIDNLSKFPISQAEFNFYMYDKNKVRVGEGYIDFSNVKAGESVRIRINATSIGTPASISVSPKNLPSEFQAYVPAKLTNLTVYSVPSGATVKVDGKDSGTTPLSISVKPGGHTLEFFKEGYTKGTYPLVVSADQLSGGSVTFELGASAHDTVEMRDGSVMTADVESVDATSVILRVSGNLQTIDRNQVKRILLIQREAPSK